MEIRVAQPAELLPGLAPIWHYVGAAIEPSEERAQRTLRVLPPGRLHVAAEGGRPEAYALYRLNMAFQEGVSTGSPSCGFTFSDLARAGRLEEAKKGVIARVDASFRTDRKPWCPEMF